jgi:uncharacterized protein involved in exopolysaccharide biosynthesis
MLQTLGPQQPAFYDEPGQGFDVSYFIGIFKRRILYFVIPFLTVAMLGVAVVEIQRPIYRAEGEIIVESPEIPPDLVRPTISEVADERIAVLKQRIIARDNITALVDKYNLFPQERASMSGTELLELMRTRLEIKPAALELIKSTGSTLAFTLSFEYEDPEIALKVASDLITQLLSDDASRRTSNAAETTKFLEQEVKRLEGQHDAVVAQIETLTQEPPHQEQAESEEVKAQMKSLTDLESDLAQKSSIYSDEHPIIKNLKKQIAALKTAIAATPRTASTAVETNKHGVAAQVLDQQRSNLEKALAEANQKLTTARLGESLERNQQSEHLRLIEQPVLPLQPIRPKKLKWFAVAFGLAGMIGAVSVVAAEMLDGSIRRSEQLLGIVDRSLIVTIPYLPAPGEERRNRRRAVLLCIAFVILPAAAVVGAMMKHTSIDFASFDRHSLSRLLHQL